MPSTPFSHRGVHRAPRPRRRRFRAVATATVAVTLAAAGTTQAFAAATGSSSGSSSSSLFSSSSSSSSSSGSGYFSSTNTTPATGAASSSSSATATGADWTFGARATISDVAKSIRADVAYSQGYTGKGVGVALIDTGVAPVQGLTSGNIANGPDLSLESQVPGLLHNDGFGHGTHMAGIIAGRDNTSGTGFRGIAPDAKLTSIKVGMSNGAVDVTQILAAIDWVVQHRNDDPANPIKIINLSYGTDSTLSRETNPLTSAVETAWKAGIVVVVAAGNTGNSITVPATDTNPIVVGSVDPKGTTNPADDKLSDFSASTGRVVGSTSTDSLSVDVLVPGRSVVSLRDPGSYVDTAYPAAREGTRYFAGSGTSQSAAVVSGAAALMLQKFPTATPAQIRAAMWGKSGIGSSPGAAPLALDLSTIFNQSIGTAMIGSSPSSGAGSLQAARGSTALLFGADKTALTGENDIFGPFSTAAWAKASKAGTAWNGGSWMGRAWIGEGWTTATNGQANWAGRAWSGSTWSGRAWSDIAWSGRAWSNGSWSGSVSFTSTAWSGRAWSNVNWQ